MLKSLHCLSFPSSRRKVAKLLTTRHISGDARMGRIARTGSDKVLNMVSLNSSVKNVAYAVRGALAIRAEELKAQLGKSPGSLPFDQVVNTNIGNPQALGQLPITYFRQVLALCLYPELMKNPGNMFPIDVLDRANKIIKGFGPIGAYTHSKGSASVRRSVAEYIAERDGYPADPEHIFLTNGASPGVQKILQSLIQHPNVGIMIPIPQYPLYSASIALFDGVPVSYYLNESEEEGWSLDPKEISRALKEARDNGVDVRALCVINPGNPTGNCLTEENIRQIIDIAHKEKLVLLADEVYQTNVYYPDRPFHSFKKVLMSMGPQYSDQELFSFHSISKGVVGECGLRGGYFECVGIDAQIIDQLYKIASVDLCPNTVGQVLVDVMVRPPTPHDASYALYKEETQAIYDSLKRRSQKLVNALNKLEGVFCAPAQGALYVHPQVTFPKKLIEQAEREGRIPDEYYAMALLNATGVCVVPGSGFLQRPGTFHFRSTFLPPEEDFDAFIERLSRFHKEFFAKYK